MKAAITSCIAVCALLSGGACSSATDVPSPAAPRSTATERPRPTAFPTFTPTPALEAGTAIVVGGDVRARAAATTQSAEVETLEDLQRVVVVAAVEGENWLVGTQTWVSTPAPWTTTWYRLQDGSFVYGAFVFALQPGESSPLADPRGQEKWVDVNVTTQTASAMIGFQPIFTAPVSTGAPGFPSPLGSHRIEKDARLAVERMTASQAGYSPSQARYDVEHVLFTQYYDHMGDALHLNYWRPASVFGDAATSHGCVGMQLHDAQYFWLFGVEGMRVEIHT